MARLTVAVLGAGVIGLSSAIRLVEALNAAGNGVELCVTVYADKFTPETTSDGAGKFISYSFARFVQKITMEEVRNCTHPASFLPHDLALSKRHKS